MIALLFLIALVLVLDPPLRQPRTRSTTLGLLAVEMVALGYPGQVATTMTTKLTWRIASMMPFVIAILNDPLILSRRTSH